MIRYIALGEYFWLGEQVTGIDADVLAKASRSDLADSALHAPQAGFWERRVLSGHLRQGSCPRMQAGVEPSTPRRQQAGSLGNPRHDY